MNQLNYRNKLVTEDDINKLFIKGGLVGIKCNDISIYHHCFSHVSYAKENIYTQLKEVFDFGNEYVDFQVEDNERIEFAGDSFINYTICEYLFNRYKTKRQDFLSKLKIKLISKEYFSKFGRYLQLGDLVLISNHMENLNGRDADSILEDTFESFIYGMIMDNIGYENTKKFIINIIEENVNFSKLIFNNENYKDRLKKYTQKQGIDLKFKNLTELGQPVNRTYVVGCFFDKKLMGTGYGKVKKSAEHECSLKILIDLGEVSKEEQTFIKNNF